MSSTFRQRRWVAMEPDRQRCTVHRAMIAWATAAPVPEEVQRLRAFSVTSVDTRVVAAFALTGALACAPAITGGTNVTPNLGTTHAVAPMIKGVLQSVTGTSPSNLWAVGSTNLGKTLILHGNGRAWVRVPSPSPGGFDALSGVAASSSTNAWAVGSIITTTHSATSGRPLILHWNGRTWTRVPAPSHGSSSFLNGVTISPLGGSPIAVGSAGSGTSYYPYAVKLHRNSWTMMTLPRFGPSGSLSGVAAASPNEVFAVGSTVSSTSHEPLILSWSSGKWKRFILPGHTNGRLLGVAALSPVSAWAVGSTSSGKTLVAHWNGLTWKQVSAPSPGAISSLNGVSADSMASAWAVGSSSSASVSRFLVVHWNGTAWQISPAPAALPPSALNGVYIPHFKLHPYGPVLVGGMASGIFAGST